MYAALQEEACGVDLTSIYVIHATALTHELPLPNPQRLMVESAAIHWAKVTPKAKLGYISEFMSGHIIEDYGAKPEHLLPTGNGINPADPFYRLRDRTQLIAKLEQYKIPIDRPLIFSWGRSVPYKKYDIVLRASAKLKDKIHPVIMVSPEYPELTQLSRQLGLDTSLIFAFDPELVASLLQWENTVAAASLAYREPFGLTPVEIRMHGRKNGALTVVSDTGGLVEQVKDGTDGFVTRQDDPDDVARVVQGILNLSHTEKDRIRKEGLKTVLDHYTWSSQILNTLAAVYPRISHEASRVRKRISDDVLSELR
jgi:glycosyltransferase involved in cell wall biosynthesis